MTREEELDWLCRLRSEIYVYMPKEWLIPMNNALDMAIKALEQEPTTKNDLGVDCISREQAQTEIEMNASRYTIARERGGMGQVEWSDQLIKVSDAVDIIRDLPSVTPQEPKTGHWIYKNYNWHCSECDETPKTLGYVGDAVFMREHFKFCNHCGAKMESEGE